MSFFPRTAPPMSGGSRRSRMHCGNILCAGIGPEIFIASVARLSCVVRFKLTSERPHNRNVRACLMSYRSLRWLSSFSAPQGFRHAGFPDTSRHELARFSKHAPSKAKNARNTVCDGVCGNRTSGTAANVDGYANGSRPRYVESCSGTSSGGLWWNADLHPAEWHSIADCVYADRD